MQQLDRTTLLAVLGERLRGLYPAEAPDTLTGVVSHTDHVRPGVAFVALAGASGHGVVHAQRALDAGATLVISDRPHPGALLVDDAAEALLALGRHARRQRRGPVVGITGSVGKTTTKTLLGAALDAATSPGNVNTVHALAGILVDVWLRERPERPLVLELGIDRRGEMRQLVDLVAPSHGVLTTVAEAHLAGIGTLADVAAEKGLLLDAASDARYAGAGAWPHLRDDQRRRTQRVAADGGDWVVRHDARRGRLRVAGLGGQDGVEIALPGPGAPYAEAALLALRVAFDLGVPAPLAARRIASARPEAHRLQLHDLGELVVIDDAYNANPTSMAAALAVLADRPRPHAAVLGDMRELGARSASAHAELGSAVGAAELDLVWFVGPESAHAAATCAVPATRHLPDADAAVAAAAALPTTGTLLVKGSRSIGLERLVAALLARHAPAVAS